MYRVYVCICMYICTLMCILGALALILNIRVCNPPNVGGVTLSKPDVISVLSLDIVDPMPEGPSVQATPLLFDSGRMP